MFQTFEVSSRPEQGPPRLEALRGVMAAEGLDGWLVPRADRFQGEYVAPADERLAWLTGFTGSAGFAVALREEAAIFVDGRYTVQVKAQVDPVFTPVPFPTVKLADWLSEHLPAGGTVGFDPWLHTLGQIEELRKALSARQIALQPRANLVDRIWEDRPTAPEAPFTAQPEEFTGEHSESKRARLAEALREAGHRAAVLTLPDSVAWLLNIRGADIAHNPVPHAFALLYDDGRCDLFCRKEKAQGLQEHLGEAVSVLPFEGFEAALRDLDSPVRLDPKSAPLAVADALRDAGVEVAEDSDPCLLPKALKTEAELAGAREAHLRDGAAMVRFLSWLDAEAPGELTEIAVVKALEGFRRETNALREVSFDTIAGAGEHGAVVHYRVTEETDAPLREGQLLLVDSGGQYADGTTDITRTMAIGAPGAEERACFTRVLKGMIAMSRLRFPKGLAGREIEAVARAPLWMAGQDYDHGTGHGVGAYLSVHEGPQGLSRRSEVPLEPGMIVSNEPGYYREGAFGIRIENLIAVREAPHLDGADDREMLDFETLTWVPIDRRLIDAEALSPEERGWIDRYHADTLRLIGPRVEGAARQWLEKACAPL